MGKNGGQHIGRSDRTAEERTNNHFRRPRNGNCVLGLWVLISIAHDAVRVHVGLGSGCRCYDSEGTSCPVNNEADGGLELVGARLDVWQIWLRMMGDSLFSAEPFVGL